MPATAGGSTSGSSTSVTSERSAAEAPGRDQVRRRRADEEDQRHARRAFVFERDDERVERHLARRARRASSPGGTPEEDRDDREQRGTRARRPSRAQSDGARTRGSHGSPNPAARSARRPSGAEERDQERLRGLEVRRPRRDRHLVDDGRLRRGREPDRRAPVDATGADVGRVDEPGVGLTERDLADDALHVRLQADRLPQHASAARAASAPRACRGRSAPSAPRRRAGASAASRGRRRSRILAGFERGHDEHEASSSRTRPACSTSPSREERLRVDAGSPRGRRRTGRPAGSAGRAGSSRRTSSCASGVDLGQHLGERGGGEHGRRPAPRARSRCRPSLRPATSAATARTAPTASEPSHRSTITARRLDDSGRAHARLQAELLDRLAGDDRDHARRLGDVDLDLREQAVDLDRADDAAEAVARRRASPSPSSPRSRSTSAAGTTRRFAASRSTRIFPSRSQRRSVSRLIPSARAASAAVQRLA